MASPPCVNLAFACRGASTCGDMAAKAHGWPARNGVPVVPPSQVVIRTSFQARGWGFRQGQVDVRFSNSLIEAFWRSLRHQWLYLHSLDSLVALRRLIGFYVTQHNSEMPHSAFAGQTPDEVYFGRGARVEDDLATARIQARSVRMEANRRASCGVCQPLNDGQTASDSGSAAVANSS